MFNSVKKVGLVVESFVPDFLQAILCVFYLFFLFHTFNDLKRAQNRVRHWFQRNWAPFSGKLTAR